MFGGRFFRANYFSAGYLSGPSSQGGTFLLALHGTGGASVPTALAIYDYLIRCRRRGRR